MTIKDNFRPIKAGVDCPSYRYFVDGEWQNSQSRRTVPIISPIDSTILGRVQSVSAKEIDVAVVSASLAQKSWASLKLEKRRAILKNVSNLIEKNSDFLSQILTREIGKPIKESKEEIEAGVEIIEETIKETDWQKVEKKKIKDKICEIQRIPRGIVVCITPFNFPIYLTLAKIIPALFAGNTVVLKPSTQGAISVLHLIQLFNLAGMPAGVLNAVTGAGENVGKKLISHRLVNVVSFTGSTKAGREIAKEVGITKLLFELGGKDAAIVLKDADLDQAAAEIAEGAFRFVGQRCVAIKRVLAAKEIKDKLIEKLKKEVHQHYKSIGDPRDPKIQLGPVVNDTQADYLARLLKDARKKGAKVICGGARLELCLMPVRFHEKILKIPQRVWQVCRQKGHGRYFQATILDNIKSNMKIAWEEQFGPILPIMSVKNEQEMINLANASDYGLDVAIFTQSNKRALAIGEKIDVGQVFINSRPRRSPNHFPFIGVKDSGLDSEGIRYSIEAMTTLKSVRLAKRL